MYVEISPVGVVTPDSARKAMPDVCAILFKEVGGSRRCLIGFPKPYWPYIVTAMFEIVTRDNEKAALHGSVVRLMERCGISIGQLIVTKSPGEFRGTLAISCNGETRREPMPLSDAIPMAFHAGAAIVMDSDQLDVEERNFSEVEGRFMIVDRMADVPLRQAEWRATHGTPHGMN